MRRRVAMSATWRVRRSPYLSILVAVSLFGAACTSPEQSRLEIEGNEQPAAVPAAGDVDPQVAARLDEIVRRQHPNVRALLIGRRGRGVVENYYGRASWETYADVQGITRTVLSMLVGIAVGEQAISDLDSTVGQLLPRHVSARTSPEVRSITLRQLLTMTSGLAPDPPYNASPTWRLVADQGWVSGIVDGGTIVTPGVVLMPSSAAAHLLSAIIAESTGRPTLRYAQEKLFGPLGIAADAAFEPVISSMSAASYRRAGFAWPRDPQGYHLGFSHLKLTALDMLKLGQLYLDAGRWRGRQIVPAGYVRESTQPYASLATTATYGYHWWLTVEQGHHAFAARGFGGQLLYVVPDLDLVVAIICAVPVTGEPETATSMETLINRVVLRELDPPD